MYICGGWRGKRLHLSFRDESDSAVFALSTDVTGENISPVRSHTEWIFLEAIETPRFPEPWDVDDFQQVLDHLRENGHYRLEGEFIEQQSPKKHRHSNANL